MAGNNNFALLLLAITAGSAISPYRILKDGSGDNVMVHATSSSDVMVAVNDSLAIASGKVGDVHRAGVVPVEYGGAVTRGDELTADSQGRAITAQPGDRIIGYAAESGVTGTIGSVLIAPGHAKPNPGAVTSASLTVTHEDLTEADGSQSFDFAAALPAGAFVLGHELRVTAFDDGGAGSFNADLGVSGADTDSIVDGASLDATANLSPGSGVRPQGLYGNVTLALTVSADVNVNTATSGSVTAQVVYVVLA